MVEDLWLALADGARIQMEHWVTGGKGNTTLVSELAIPNKPRTLIRFLGQLQFFLKHNGFPQHSAKPHRKEFFLALPVLSSLPVATKDLAERARAANLKRTGMERNAITDKRKATRLSNGTSTFDDEKYIFNCTNCT